MTVMSRVSHRQFDANLNAIQTIAVSRQILDTPAMNFFEHQQQARSASTRMIVLFALAVLGVVVGITGIFLVSVGTPEAGPDDRWVGAAVIAGTLTLIILGASAYKTFSLRDGGSTVAHALGGVPVHHHHQDYHYRRLINVVEEMAIAAGVPCPEIFVLEKEDSINAFAAGYSTSDAAVAVTRGALMRLSRDELQGVIAHEFSHILNGDMRLNIRLVGLIFGLMAIGVIGEYMMRGGSKSRDGKGIVFVGLAFLVLGYGGMFFGRMIKASISRNREFLADASAVQFSRQTIGLAGALKKAGGFASGSALQHKDREEVDHMLFADGAELSKMFATHPELSDRIKRLDPSFRPEQFAKLASKESTFDQWHADDDPPSASSLLGQTADLSAPSNPSSNMVSAITNSVANPSQSHVGYAHALRLTIPSELRQAAHTREQVVDVLLGLVVSPQAAWRNQQLDLIEKHLGQHRRQGVNQLLPSLMQLAAEQRLPLASVAFPSLKLRSESELREVCKCLRALVNVDGKIDVFEYCLARLLERYVDESFAPAKSKPMGTHKLLDCKLEIQSLFAVIASLGHQDAATAARAFQAGVHEALPNQLVSYTANSNWLGVLDQTLPTLDRLLPYAKRQLVMAMTTMMNFDAVITVAEGEILRVLCAYLHCPLPPILEAADANKLASAELPTALGTN